MAGLEEYIRAAARKRGIDPDIAVKVANSEGGLKDPTRQSGVMKNGAREPSYGPFQLLVGGEGTGFPAGLGNDFIKATGKDPRNPEHALAGIDYALDTAARDGWGRWYGAKAVGLGNRAGIGGAPANVEMPQVALSRGVPQGNVAPDANGIMPPLAAAPDIAAAAKPDLGTKIGNAIFGEKLAGDLKGMFGAGAPTNGPGASAMGLFKQAMGGGQNAQAQQAAQQITPSSISVDDSAQRAQAGAQLMASLMSARRKPMRGMAMGA